MTTIERLGAQHQEVLARLADTEAGLDAQTSPDLGRFHTYLEYEVVAHFGLEEDALFPLLERHMSPQFGPLAVMNAEHLEFRELLAAFGDAVRGGNVPVQTACARQIIDRLRAHIAKEDRVLFPMATQVLSADELAEVEHRAAALAATTQPVQP